MALSSQLALVARVVQGLWKAGLAEVGQLSGKEDWQIQASGGTEMHGVQRAVTPCWRRRTRPGSLALRGLRCSCPTAVILTR